MFRSTAGCIPAIERLAALGYVQSELMGLRPWTRIECARMLEEAGDLLSERGIAASRSAAASTTRSGTNSPRTSALLGNERNQSLRMESVYTRVTEISGPPLRDSYHFGQTIINDFGRPYGEGTNDHLGIFRLGLRQDVSRCMCAANTSMRRELPAYSEDVRDVIAKEDDNPVQPAEPVPMVNQFDLLDTYALMNLERLGVFLRQTKFVVGAGPERPD